jgi:hypothetical protein
MTTGTLVATYRWRKVQTKMSQMLITEVSHILGSLSMTTNVKIRRFLLLGILKGLFLKLVLIISAVHLLFKICKQTINSYLHHSPIGQDTSLLIAGEVFSCYDKEASHSPLCKSWA